MAVHGLGNGKKGGKQSGDRKGIRQQVNTVLAQRKPVCTVWCRCFHNFRYPAAFRRPLAKKAHYTA
ncbi:hypothetical protein l13_17200 [Neisseria weaveri ATCC 51223]|nr:hypothetical protein l13_17200 [Neisseria weaveri ATCC 51223]